jgi:CRISPR system Cascade subunit CasE
LINSYQLHQAIYHAFPKDGAGRVLYRIDENQRLGTISLLVQSEKEPDWQKAEYLTLCLIDKAEFHAFTPDLKSGRTLFFRLRANPSVKKQEEGKKNGYREGLIKEEDQLAWLNRKAESGGFSIISCHIIPEGIAHDDRSGAANDKLRHFAVCFEGVLKVTDEPIFIETVKNGIGSAKGFGFGLLSLAPLKD